ncbi:MAG TPA: hypothetical protein PK257_02740 [Candidatus Woesebacteria bacterium]|nr:hypothetical protein [Candidatus Woesebacteria bacterium]
MREKPDPEKMTIANIVGELSFNHLLKRRKEKLCHEISHRPIDTFNIPDWICAFRIYLPKPISALNNRIPDIKDFILNRCRNLVLLELILQSPRNLPPEIIAALKSKISRLSNPQKEQSSL